MHFLKRLLSQDIANKIGRIQKEEDVVRLFEAHVLLNQSTLDDVKNLLTRQYIPFKMATPEVVAELNRDCYQ